LNAAAPPPAPAVPATEGVRAFARRLGCRPGYVTELRRRGRLVLTHDGKAICVADSLARIEATRDPTKAGVRDYHARARQNAAAALPAPGTGVGGGVGQVAASGAHSAIDVHPASDPSPPANSAANGPECPATPRAETGPYLPAAPPENDPDAPAESEYALRRARALAAKEEALARKAQREELIELGSLLARDDVLAAVSEAGVQFRMRLEQLPAVIAPQLAAAADEAQVRVLLREALDGVLAALSRAFAAIAPAEPPP